MQAEPSEKIMTDEEATPFHWWLLQQLREQLFNPKDIKITDGFTEPASTQGA